MQSTSRALALIALLAGFGVGCATGLPVAPDADPNSPTDGGFNPNLDGGFNPPADAAGPIIDAGPMMVTITQSMNPTLVTAGNSVSCNVTDSHADNHYYRVFNLPQMGITSAFNITSVSFGVEQALAGIGGTQPIQVKLYTLNGGISMNNLSPIGNLSLNLPDQATSIYSANVAGIAPAGSTLVVEVFSPDGQAANHSFFIGSNTGGQSGPSYLAASECGVADMTDTGTIGSPSMHIVMSVTGTHTP